MSSEQVEGQKPVDESGSQAGPEVKFEEKEADKMDVTCLPSVTVTTTEQTDVREQPPPMIAEWMATAVRNLDPVVANTSSTGADIVNTESLVSDGVPNLEVDNTQNGIQLFDETPVSEPGTGEGQALTVEGNKEGASEMKVTEDNNNDGPAATTVPQSDNVPDEGGAMAAEGLSTDVLPEETFKLEHKFDVGDLVEGCSAEDGLEGAWFKGIIKEISGRNASVQFEDLLDDNETDKLEEWYPLDHDRVITLSPDGKPISDGSAPEEGGDEVLKSVSRKLRPASSLEPFETAGKENPNGKKFEPSKPSSGDQIEARYDDAWWEAVVVSIKGKNISVFYPGNKDDGVVKPTAARPQLIYEDGFWVINKQKSSLDLLQLSGKEPNTEKSKAVSRRKSTGKAKKPAAKGQPEKKTVRKAMPGRKSAKSPSQKKPSGATGKGGARMVRIKSPKVSASPKQKVVKKSVRETTKKVKSLEKISAADDSKAKKKPAAKRLSQGETKSPKTGKAKVGKTKPVTAAKKGKEQQVTKTPEKTKASPKAKAEPKVEVTKSRAVRSARVAEKSKPGPSKKAQKPDKSVEKKAGTRAKVGVVTTPKGKGKKGVAANEQVAEGGSGTPASTRSTRSKGPAPNPAESVQLALAETNSPLAKMSVKAVVSGKPRGRGANKKEGQVSSNQGRVDMNGENSNKVTTMVFETRVTRGHVTVTTSPANNKTTPKRKLQENETNSPNAKRGRNAKKDSAVDETVVPASPPPAAPKGRGGKPAKGKEPAATATSPSPRLTRSTPTKSAKDTANAPVSGEKRKRG